jgi:hypothetical protein
LEDIIDEALSAEDVMKRKKEWTKEIIISFSA